METNTKEVSSYEQQALDFLTKTDTALEVTFLEHTKYWPDDKEARDIYQFTLTRGSRSYSAKFGQSISSSLYQVITIDQPWNKNTYAIGITKKYTNYKDKIIKGKESDARRWKGKELTPTAYDILACLTTSDPGTFENFCSEYCYDTDSRKAEETYKAVKAEYLGLCALFTDKEMKELQEIN